MMMKVLLCPGLSIAMNCTCQVNNAQDLRERERERERADLCWLCARGSPRAELSREAECAEFTTDSYVEPQTSSPRVLRESICAILVTTI